MPFAMLTNSLSGKSMGTYLGLFNCTICLPQIVAALVGGFLFKTFGGEMVALENGTMVQSGQAVMLLIAGISLVLGAIAVFGIGTKKNK